MLNNLKTLKYFFYTCRAVTECFVLGRTIHTTRRLARSAGWVGWTSCWYGSLAWAPTVHWLPTRLPRGASVCAAPPPSACPPSRPAPSLPSPPPQSHSSSSSSSTRPIPPLATSSTLDHSLRPSNAPSQRLYKQTTHTLIFYSASLILFYI